MTTNEVTLKDFNGVEELTLKEFIYEDTPGRRIGVRVVRWRDPGRKVVLDIREHTVSQEFTGWTKNGITFSVETLKALLELANAAMIYHDGVWADALLAAEPDFDETS